MNQPRLLIYVQNLLGIGHLRRAAGVSRAAVDKGFDVTFVSGGMPINGLDVGGAPFIKFHRSGHLMVISKFSSMKTTIRLMINGETIDVRLF